MSSEPWIPVEGIEGPIQEMVMYDFDMIDEITHPTRARLLRRLQQPRSAAELAADMDIPVTRLYHHLNRMVELNLIRVVATRRSGSATERRYQTTARSYRVDESVIEQVSNEELGRAIGGLFDVTKTEFQREVEIGTLTTTNLASDGMFGMFSFALDEPGWVEFRERLQALLDEFTARDDPNFELPRRRVFVAAFPRRDD
jgi:hypothetical protein